MPDLLNFVIEISYKTKGKKNEPIGNNFVKRPHGLTGLLNNKIRHYGFSGAMSLALTRITQEIVLVESFLVETLDVQQEGNQTSCN